MTLSSVGFSACSSCIELARRGRFRYSCCFTT
jgi:hypothetical protein